VQVVVGAQHIAVALAAALGHRQRIRH
jgi:hypothetical protein